MTLPVRADAITIYAGDTGVWPLVEIFAADGTTPLVLTGTWIAQWRTTPQSVDVIPLTVDTSQMTVGVINISASPAQTAQFTEQGCWDLQNTSPGGVVKTWVFGQVATVKDVSRV